MSDRVGGSPGAAPGQGGLAAGLSARRRAAEAAGLALCGFALSYAQAPYSLALAAPALLAAAFVTGLGRDVAAGAARAAARGAWFFGVGYFLPGLLWIGEAFLVDADVFGWMRPFAVTILPMGLSLFWALGAAGAALLVRYCLQRRGAARASPLAAALALTGALTLAELARGHVLTGFPWGLVGFVWIDWPIAQTAALIGPYGVTWATLLAGFGLGAAAARLAAGDPGARGAVGKAAGRAAVRAAGAAAGIALAPLMLFAAYGAARLAEAPSAPPADAPVIRLVQPNVPQNEKWRPDLVRRNLLRLIDLSAGEPGAADPTLVVWPETAVPVLVGGDPQFRQEVMAALAERGVDAPLVLGAQRVETGPDGSRRFFNSAFMLAPGTGAVVARYDKHHLVPFGEFLPFQDFLESLGVAQLAGRSGGFAAGPGPIVLAPEGVPSFAPLICYEAIFPQDMPPASAAPDMLLQLTNDAWFGASSGPHQHLVQARWRAIEQGAPLLRSANTGISTGVDAYGRLGPALLLEKMGTVDISLPQATERTVYSRARELWTIVLVLGTLVAAGYCLLTGRANS